MQRRILISFSGSRYHDSTKRIAENAEHFGASEPAWIYDDVWLKTKRPEHCARTKWAIDDPQGRGVNWFAFKPLVVQDAVRRAPDGSIVLFTDADCWPVANMTPLFDMCERDSIVLFAACSHSQRHWCKRDCMALMGMDSDFWRDKQAGVARFMLFKKGGIHSPKEPFNPGIIGAITPDIFLEEWLDCACDERKSTFKKSSIYPEYSDLKEHRTEQAMLTNLAHKYNIPLHREADQWGNDFKKDFPNDTYGQIFESTGVYSYDPDDPERKNQGSKFRNIHD